MAIRIGINGFGRIGRNVLRASLTDPALEFVRLTITRPHFAHLLKYDRSRPSPCGGAKKSVLIHRPGGKVLAQRPQDLPGGIPPPPPRVD